VFTVVAKALENWAPKPFDHIVIDEAQDLAPAELRFFAALAPNGLDGLFLSGDAGQRIFQHPYSWTSLGVDVRGRSHTLKVCYRTSQQIRRAADRLLPTVLRDQDAWRTSGEGSCPSSRGRGRMSSRSPPSRRRRSTCATPSRAGLATVWRRRKSGCSCGRKTWSRARGTQLTDLRVLTESPPRP
jgi:hypothetical protein